MIADKKYIKHVLSKTPTSPGIYRMKDEEGGIIYIGKAKNLKNRLSTYFNESPKDNKTQMMLDQLADFEFTVVSTELEAIMLETNQIKKFRPKYNILMKDDKNYVYIKITVNEDYPRVLITRFIEKDGSKYFGPKTAQHKVEKTLKVLKRIFPFRHCNLCIAYVMPLKNGKHKVKVTKAGIKYPCIDYHIARCPGPCIGNVSKEQYRYYIDQIIRFFEGKHEEVLGLLHKDMQKAAADKKFESAAAIRDKIKSVEDILEKQLISAPDHQNADIINYAANQNKIFFNLFQVREGKLINQENFEFIAKGTSRDSTHDNEALAMFITQYYEKATDIPKNILLPHPPEDQHNLQKFISDLSTHVVKFLYPQRGRSDKLLDLCHKNALNYSRLSEAKWQGHEQRSREDALIRVQNLFKLENKPNRIECFDISHHGGTETVASMVVFEKGFPKKDHYRKFRLQQNTSGHPDDYKSMEEALTRRLKYLKPTLIDKKISIKKATKKEFEQFFKKNTNQNSESQLLKITINKIDIGLAEIKLHKPQAKIVIIPHLNKSPKDDFDKLQLVRKLAVKYKLKRIHLIVDKSATATWENIGFQIVKNIPEYITLKKRQTLVVLDIKKISQDRSFKSKPSLIVIDGGKGQLGVAIKTIKKANLTIPVVSLAKKNEEIFSRNEPTPIQLAKDSPTLHMFQHIRDEAHRFAISYHENVYLKTFKSSSLDIIPGIGESTKMKLFKHFGSLQAIKSATLYELEKVVGKKNAIKLISAINKL